jgi:hypothetical protein
LADSWVTRGGGAIADLFLLSEAQMLRIQPYFPLTHGIAMVDDRRVISGIVYGTCCAEKYAVFARKIQ